MPTEKKGLSLNEMGIDMSKMNENDRDNMRLNMSASAIPDLDELLVNVNELLEFIESPAMKKMEEKNHDEFEECVARKYNNIIPMKIINLMTEPESQRYDNLSTFLDMIDRLKKVKQGSNMQDEHKKWCENMNEKFVYSAHGGKENFEKKMKQLAEEKKNSENK